MRGVILYGPPASGKDTITQALAELDPEYKLFPRLKAGPRRTTGYRVTPPEAIDALRERCEIVWENQRYQTVYVVDRPSLLERLADYVPVLHLGQLEAIDAVAQATPDARWLVVYLGAPETSPHDGSRPEAPPTRTPAYRLGTRPSPSSTLT